MELHHHPGQQVLIYRERSKLCEGPYTIVMQADKIVTVQL
jgi:hypothetical protein